MDLDFSRALRFRLRPQTSSPANGVERFAGGQGGKPCRDDERAATSGTSWFHH